jgi:hypothetical protein
MLVDGAALGRHIAPQSGQRLLQPSPAIDNQELRLAQLALDEVVEDGPPSLAGLATHILDRQQHLLAVRRLRIFGQRDKLKTDRSKKGREKWV